MKNLKVKVATFLEYRKPSKKLKYLLEDGSLESVDNGNGFFTMYQDNINEAINYIETEDFGAAFDLPKKEKVAFLRELNGLLKAMKLNEAEYILIICE